ncbi:HesB/IscA family protein [Paenibacillus glucanolyticus]|uniref:HesB/IscA family protein n=1 Tax=Paenibacillus glucanolyticus TaxID=59843 RepID=UPI00096F7DEE|nr:iron-sulfur cluster assembly accessory protein [Paenibacillus glucanolyticus]OMF67173.1 hypothetical protein BK142_28405 [Paenibacillus glucanolyticus]
MIEISDKAKSVIDEMIHTNSDSNLFLRVGIEDGGCSGLSYHIKLDNTLTEHDNVLPQERFQIVWDKRSEDFLEGIQIDYMDQGMTGGFTIDNPNAKATCGCGASFRTATYKGNRQKCD